MNLSKLMSQAQEMKKEIEKAQKKVESLVVEGGAKDGAVVVVLRGDGTLEDVKIAHDLCVSFPDMVGDLVMLAHKDAFKNLQEKKKYIMKDMPGSGAGFGF